MATRSVTWDRHEKLSTVTAKWLLLTTTDTAGEAIEYQDFMDRCVQVFGTFGAGGTVTIQGSNEATPTTWATLTDPQGNALTFTAAGIEQVTELPRWIRPAAVAGDGTTSLNVYLHMRGRER